MYKYDCRFNFGTWYKNFCSFLILLLPLTLSSCGFQPVYKTSNKAVIPQIHINSINSVAGSELYHRLSDVIDSSEGARYHLDIKLVYTSSPLAITKSSDVVQQSASQTVHYKLIDESGIEINSGGFTVTGSYNTTSSAYATHVEERQEGLNLAGKAAEEIHRRLIIYFSTHRLTKE